jgi:GTPase
VVDLGHPHAAEQIRAVNAVLEEIGARQKPTLMVFNKVDKVTARELAARWCQELAPAVAVSARTGEGFDQLFAQVGAMLKPIRDFLELRVPHAEQRVIARLHAVGQIVEQDYRGATARFRARIPPYVRHEFEPYIVAGAE